MAEYISKDELKAAILKRLGISGEQYLVHSEKVLVDVINKMSPADVVERKTGSWRHYEGELTCSECAVTIYDDIMSLLGDDVPRFCPNCGARMIGGDEDV